MENKEELQDSLKPDELDELDKTSEDVEALKSQRDKLYARAKKAEEELKSLKDKPLVPPVQPSAASKDDIETVLELRSQGYSDSEILHLRKYSKKMNATIDEVSQDPFIKSGIEAERAKAKVEQAMPNPSSGRSFQVNNKTWGEMTEEERKKNFSAMSEQFK